MIKQQYVPGDVFAYCNPDGAVISLPRMIISAHTEQEQLQNYATVLTISSRCGLMKQMIISADEGGPTVLLHARCCKTTQNV